MTIWGEQHRERKPWQMQRPEAEAGPVCVTKGKTYYSRACVDREKERRQREPGTSNH